ncbi:MAG: KipI family sensor histidine kinase inhibitor [Bermanella sp.]|jgi:KipI family sensor histidine kinase inhibitor
MKQAKRYTQACFSAVGDCAMLVELGAGIDEALNESVLQLEAQIHALAIAGIEETTPAYNSLLLHYNPDLISFSSLQETVSGLDVHKVATARQSYLWRVPVCYGGEFGEDLERVAHYHHLSTDVLIQRHCAPRYRVYMMGFAPGYTYLGGLDETLHTLRRENPRLHTPAGSISIGGMQALIAGVAMPSGWQLLGQTPIATYAPDRDPPFLITPGDAIEFFVITPDEFTQMKQAVAKGDWVAQRTALND